MHFAREQAMFGEKHGGFVWNCRMEDDFSMLVLDGFEGKNWGVGRFQMISLPLASRQALVEETISCSIIRNRQTFPFPATCFPTFFYRKPGDMTRTRKELEARNQSLTNVSEARINNPCFDGFYHQFTARVGDGLLLF